MGFVFYKLNNKKLVSSSNRFNGGIHFHSVFSFSLVFFLLFLVKEAKKATKRDRVRLSVCPWGSLSRHYSTVPSSRMLPMVALCAPFPCQMSSVFRFYFTSLLFHFFLELLITAPGSGMHEI